MKTNKAKEPKKNKKVKKATAPHAPSPGIRKRIILLFSNLRFSLTFRIALHYVSHLLRTTLSYLILFTLIYAAAQVPQIVRIIGRTTPTLPTDSAYYQPLETDTYDVDVYLSPDVLPYGNEAIRQQLVLMFSEDLFRWPPILRVGDRAENGTWIYSFNLVSRLELYFFLVGALLLFDIMRSIGFIRYRNRLAKSVLKPIREITDMAATLSASNLSNRINIAGTKNELKDLAFVINTMLDRIERSYNSQKQFVSDASHELRTPIAVIQGYINMLNRWGKDDKDVLDEGLSAIAQETESMKDLVESLLFLARHDKKTLLLEMEDFDPCEVMASVHREAKLVSSQYNFILNPLEHCIIRADKNMIKQVVRILSDNAVKYTREGGTITLGVQRAANGCVLTISDTGEGISDEDLPKIFDRFYRADGARKAQASGHGLGLSIARIIVLAHNGKLSVKSKVGVGTIFTVTLPATFQSK